MKAGLLHVAGLGLVGLSRAWNTDYPFGHPPLFPVRYPTKTSPFAYPKTNYNITAFSGPNCTGSIEQGPFVDFDCTMARCWSAPGTLSVLYEGGWYWDDCWPFSPFKECRDPEARRKDKNAWQNEDQRDIFSFIHRDGPVALAFSSGDCARETMLGTVMINRRILAVCATLDAPAYSISLNFQHKCNGEARRQQLGKPPPPSGSYTREDFWGDHIVQYFTEWEGDRKHDGRKGPREKEKERALENEMEEMSDKADDDLLDDDYPDEARRERKRKKGKGRKEQKEEEELQLEDEMEEPSDKGDEDLLGDEEFLDDQSSDPDEAPDERKHENSKGRKKQNRRRGAGAKGWRI